MRIKILPAFHGDSIIISFESDGTTKHILIDGGPSAAYRCVLKNELKKIQDNEESIELLIITHIDDDHIGGIIKLFEYDDIDKNIIKKIWFNSGNILSKEFSKTENEKREIQITDIGDVSKSYKQGITLEKEILKYGWKQEIIKTGNENNISGVKIKVLTPSKETLRELNNNWQKEGDKKVKMAATGNDHSLSIDKLLENAFVEHTTLQNKSSISFIIEFDDKKILMLGDAISSEIIKGLKLLGYSENNKIVTNFVKLPHHGSKYNLSYELLKMIECDNFIVSTDGTRHCLPDKETFARIITYYPEPINLFFNYKEIAEKTFLPEERKRVNLFFLEATDFILEV